MITAQLFFPFMSDPFALAVASPRSRSRRPRRPAPPKPLQLCLPLTFAPIVRRRVSPWREWLVTAWRWLVAVGDVRRGSPVRRGAPSGMKDYCSGIRTYYGICLGKFL